MYVWALVLGTILGDVMTVRIINRAGVEVAFGIWGDMFWFLATLGYEPLMGCPEEGWLALRGGERLVVEVVG